MSRISKLQGKFDDLYIDAFLVTNQQNIYYLTGFDLMQGDGCLLITRDNAIMITDGRYETALAEFESDEVVATITRDYYGAVNKICQALNVQVLGFENMVSYQLFDVFDELMEADIVPFDNLIEDMRAIKDSEEIAKLRTAAKLHDEGYEYFLSIVKPGMTEWELTTKLDYWMKMHGASAASFPTIVASGENSAKPHATASQKKIQSGEIVTLDFGYFVDGYTADITRTFAVGAIDSELRDIYEIVNEARQQVIDHAKARISGAKLDAYGRSLINEAGYGDEFNHGMGHGIGLSVHELPQSYGPGTPNLHLKNNQVITVEPGIYIPQLGGVRIEDDIIIKHDGAEVITRAPTDLITI